MHSFSVTDIGMRRKMNQDFVCSSDESVGNLPNLYLLADGMGGHKAGDFASRFTVRETLRLAAANRSSNPIEILGDALHAVNQNLHHTASVREDLSGCGTTIVAATIEGDVLRTANVGDSRLYIVGDTIEQITEDHSLVQEMVRLGEMDEESARNHPNKNIITRAIGASEDVKIDIFEKQLHDGEYIVLCSDGLTNMVEDSMILQVLHGEGTLADKTERLVELANQNGGKDNITVTIIEPNSDEVTEC